MCGRGTAAAARKASSTPSTPHPPLAPVVLRLGQPPLLQEGTQQGCSSRGPSTGQGMSPPMRRRRQQQTLLLRPATPCPTLSPAVRPRKPPIATISATTVHPLTRTACSQALCSCSGYRPVSQRYLPAGHQLLAIPSPISEGHDDRNGARDGNGASGAVCEYCRRLDGACLGLRPGRAVAAAVASATTLLCVHRLHLRGRRRQPMGV